MNKFRRLVLLAVGLTTSIAVMSGESSMALFVHSADGGSVQTTELEDIQLLTFSDDNLLLKYTDGSETPIAFTSISKLTFGETLTTSIPSAVDFANSATVIAYYNIMGQKLYKEPESGFYIIMYENGTSKKVMKK